MKGFLLPGVLAGGVVSGGVQQKVSTNSEVMKTNTSTIRLIYPQWQGGNVAAMVPEVKDPDDAARGYYLGAQLLDFLAPCGGQETLTVPVSTVYSTATSFSGRRKPRWRCCGRAIPAGS